MQETLNDYPNLAIRAASVLGLVFDHEHSERGTWGKVTGVRLGGCYSDLSCSQAMTIASSVDTGEIIPCSQVVLCTGTFLSGEIHIGIVLSIQYTRYIT